METPIFGSESSAARESRKSLELDATSFIKKLDEIRSGANTRIFAQRARQIVVNAYADRNGVMVIRDHATAEQVAIANKLIAMGWIEAVNGRGRSLLRK